MAKTIRNKKRCTKKGVFGYVIGSVALCAAAFLVIPEVLPYISGTINKRMVKKNNEKKSDDDWGPVIERKTPDKIDEGDE